ncbi:unnamed protein product, partial [marine sediment metagenome]
RIVDQMKADGEIVSWRDDRGHDCWEMKEVG